MRSAGVCMQSTHGIRASFRVTRLRRRSQTDAVKIMSARVVLKPEEYLPLLKGTRLLTAKEAKEVMKKDDDQTSLYGSSKTVDQLDVRNNIYKESQNVDKYIDPSFIKGM